MEPESSGYGLMDILSGVGHTLSTPRRYLWQALGGPEYGNELISNWTGMDKDALGTQLLGMGAEMIGDPLTYAGAALGGLTKLGGVGSKLYGAERQAANGWARYLGKEIPVLEAELAGRQNTINTMANPIMDEMTTFLKGTRRNRPIDLLGIAQGKTNRVMADPDMALDLVENGLAVIPPNSPVWNGQFPIDLYGRANIQPRSFRFRPTEINGKEFVEIPRSALNSELGYANNGVRRVRMLNTHPEYDQAEHYAELAGIDRRFPAFDDPTLERFDLDYLRQQYSKGSYNAINRQPRHDLIARDLSVERMRKHLAGEMFIGPEDLNPVPGAATMAANNLPALHGIQNAPLGIRMNPRADLRSMRADLALQEDIAKFAGMREDRGNRIGGALLGAIYGDLPNQMGSYLRE